LNKFADLSPNEFKSKILMNTKRQSKEFTRLNNPERYTFCLIKLKKLLKYFYKNKTNRFLPNIEKSFLPESFDWRQQNPTPVTPVKDQGSVGE
jgi:hypothetical protein